MVLKRLLAVLLAVGMIAGALQLRAARDEDGTAPIADGDEEAAPPGDGTALTLSCAVLLEQVCRDLVPLLAEDGFAVTVQRPTSVVGGPPADLGAVISLAPLPELMAASGGGPEPDPASGRVLARSPLVAAVWEDRAEVLRERCGGVLSWQCIGEAASGSGTWDAVGGNGAWGPVKPGHADPATSEAGLLVLGHLAASHFGRADVTSRDLDDIGFFSWFTALEQAVPSFRPSSGSPLLAMIQFGPSSYDVVGVVEAEAVDLLARSADRASTLRLQRIEPLATADVHVTPVGSDGQVEDLVEAVAAQAPELLAQAGWRVEGRAPEGALEQVGVQDLGSLPASTGLPSAGTLEALRRTWSEVTR